jgi:hypothetical protein
MHGFRVTGFDLDHFRESAMSLRFLGSLADMNAPDHAFVLNHAIIVIRPAIDLAFNTGLGVGFA